MLHYLIITNDVHCNDISSFTEIMASIDDNRRMNIIFNERLILFIDQFHKKLCIGFLSLMDKIVADIIF